MVKIAEFTLISFFVCVLGVYGLTSAEDCRLFAKDVKGLVTPVPYGELEAIDMMVF